MPLGLPIRHWLAVGLAAVLVSLAALPVAAAKTRGESRKAGKAQKDKAGAGQDREETGSGKDPANFAEAFEQGKTALDDMQAAAVGGRMAEEEKDAATVAKLAKDKATFEANAFRLLQLALTLADKGPPKERPKIEDLNSARYFLCFLYYDKGNYYEAAVMGDFLARHYPETSEGRQAARITLASFVKLFGQSKPPDQEFEVEGIRQIAEFITKHWPNEEEAEDAALTLLNFAIQQRQLDKALEYLGRIPETSPRRASAELRAGQALWTTYLKAAQAPAAERPPAEELERFKTQAEKTLSAGVARMKDSGSVDPTIAAAMLSLAQIYLEMNENAKVITTLEDEKFGPLTLLKDKNPATAREGFAVETYKLALRAYVAEQTIKKATKVMGLLEKAIGQSGDPKAAQNLTLIYIGLGRELQQHMERLRKDGKTKEFEALSAAFETFLQRIVERGAGNTFGSLSWVAETFYSRAVGADNTADSAPDKAKAYYSRAAEGYQQILDRAAKDQAFAPSAESLVGIRMRKAVCERRRGNFDAAIKLLADVLRERPKMLTAQIEGAETYAAIGPTNKIGYLQAIGGGEPNRAGENVLWGWGKIAKMTQDDKKFAETFYQARLKVAEYRYLYALKLDEKPQREKFALKAKQDLLLTYKLYPLLGGPASYAKFDQLLKQVQKTLGEEPNGF